MSGFDTCPFDGAKLAATQMRHVGPVRLTVKHGQPEPEVLSGWENADVVWTVYCLTGSHMFDEMLPEWKRLGLVD